MKSVRSTSGSSNARGPRWSLSYFECQSAASTFDIQCFLYCPRTSDGHTRSKIAFFTTYVGESPSCLLTTLQPHSLSTDFAVMKRLQCLNLSLHTFAIAYMCIVSLNCALSLNILQTYISEFSLAIVDILRVETVYSHIIKHMNHIIISIHF